MTNPDLTPDAFRVAPHAHGVATILELEGELDIAASPKLGVAVHETVWATPELLVIDLRRVSFLDTTGLSILLNARRLCVRRGIALKLACDVDSTLKMLALTRLDRDFEIYSNPDDALEAFANERAVHDTRASATAAEEHRTSL